MPKVVSKCQWRKHTQHNWRIDNTSVGCPEMTFGPTKGGELRNVLTREHHSSQSEDWTFCVSLATRTCNVWYKLLSPICQSTGRHFKHFVDMLIYRRIIWRCHSNSIWHKTITRQDHKVVSEKHKPIKNTKHLDHDSTLAQLHYARPPMSKYS